MRMKILKIYGTFVGIGLIYFLWTKVTQIYIPCFYLTTTGFLCPGCGTTRMFLSILRLDFAGAFSHNPVVFLLFIIWNLISLLCFLGKPSFIKNEKFLYSALVISVILLLIFGVLRNMY